MSGKGKTPAAPDYVGLAQEQGKINEQAARQSAALNRVNQITPYGSVTYRRPATATATAPSAAPTSAQGGQPSPSTSPSSQSVAPPTGLSDAFRYLSDRQAADRQASAAPAVPYDPSTDQWEQVTTLSPEQQQLFDVNQQNQIGLGRAAGTALGRVAGMPQFSLDQFGKVPGAGDYAGDRQRVEDALYGSASRYLDPQFGQREEATRARLLNSGIREGSEAFRSEMDQLGRDRALSYGDARDRAILAGGSEQSRLLADALRGRQQGISEATLERQLPLQEFMSLYGGGGTTGIPQAGIPQAGGVQPYDLLGAANAQYGAQVDAYNAKQAGRQGLLGGLAGLGGTLGAAAILASDERLKENIESIGELSDGTGVYEYAYKADPGTRHVGVMAQEIEQTQPDAVIEHPNGYKMVDYRRVLARALRGQHALV